MMGLQVGFSEEEPILRSTKRSESEIDLDEYDQLRDDL